MSLVLAAAQDPGGARALGPVIRALHAAHARQVAVVSRGYATGVFASDGIASDIVGSDDALDAAVRAARVVVTGTASSRPGDPMPLDQAAWIAARAAGVRSLAVLDSWQNHPERFSAPGSTAFDILPDRIAVMDDETAVELRQEGVPPDRIVVTGQPYLDQYAQAAAACTCRRDGSAPVVLYVADPAGERHIPDYHPGYRLQAPGDHTRNTVVVHYLAEMLARLAPGATVIVRPHPKSEPDEFVRFERHPGPIAIRVDGTPSPADAIAGADIVVGLMALTLVEAYLVGRRVISVVPQAAEEGQLILNRRGLIQPVRSVAELEAALAASLREAPRGAAPHGLTDGRATERVVALIRQMQ